MYRRSVPPPNDAQSVHTYENRSRWAVKRKSGQTPGERPCRPPNLVESRSDTWLSWIRTCARTCRTFVSIPCFKRSSPNGHPLLGYHTVIALSCERKKNDKGAFPIEMKVVTFRLERLHFFRICEVLHKNLLCIKFGMYNFCKYRLWVINFVTEPYRARAQWPPAAWSRLCSLSLYSKVFQLESLDIIFKTYHPVIFKIIYLLESWEIHAWLSLYADGVSRCQHVLFSLKTNIFMSPHLGRRGLQNIV
jgi:hypothetical protein